MHERKSFKSSKVEQLAFDGLNFLQLDKKINVEKMLNA